MCAVSVSTVRGNTGFDKPSQNFLDCGFETESFEAHTFQTVWLKDAALGSESSFSVYSSSPKNVGYIGPNFASRDTKPNPEVHDPWLNHYL